MILEIAQIQVRPGSGDEFERAVDGARVIFARALGFRGMRLRRSIEAADKFWLLAEWDTLENHTVDFRGSPDFDLWRALAAPFFVAPPIIEHVRLDD